MDPVQGFIALRKLLLRRPEGVELKPALQAAVDRLVGGEALGEHPPCDAADQDVEDGMCMRSLRG